MLISIDESLFAKVKLIIKKSNHKLYLELDEIKPMRKPKDYNLSNARAIKTKRVKETIKETIKTLWDKDISPTRYQIDKNCDISYTTINKYYQELLDEVKDGEK